MMSLDELEKEFFVLSKVVLFGVFSNGFNFSYALYQSGLFIAYNKYLVLFSLSLLMFVLFYFLCLKPLFTMSYLNKAYCLLAFVVYSLISLIYQLIYFKGWMGYFTVVLNLSMCVMCFYLMKIICLNRKEMMRHRLKQRASS